MELEECIADALDVSMQGYTKEEKQVTDRNDIVEMTDKLKAELSGPQADKLISLLNAVNMYDGRFASEAYVHGVVEGIALKKKTEQ